MSPMMKPLPDVRQVVLRALTSLEYSLDGTEWRLEQDKEEATPYAKLISKLRNDMLLHLVQAEYVSPYCYPHLSAPEETEASIARLCLGQIVRVHITPKGRIYCSELRKVLPELS